MSKILTVEEEFEAGKNYWLYKTDKTGDVNEQPDFNNYFTQTYNQ